MPLWEKNVSPPYLSVRWDETESAKPKMMSGTKGSAEERHQSSIKRPFGSLMRSIATRAQKALI